MDADKQEEIIAFVLRCIFSAILYTDCAAIHQTLELPVPVPCTVSTSY